MEELTVERDQNVLMFRSLGEITLESAGVYKNKLDEALGGERPETVIWDLSGVTFIDSSGIGLLVASSTRSQSAGSHFYLYRPSAQVRKILSLVKLIDFFNIIENEVDLGAILPE
ncbi:MAG: STAS domain-containing protein [Desulfovibrionaceae bacterium]|nr:STAS domain-containing protein [Desulfovibrionaceae bacterium]MBF0514137.1 STAS domain-containing protein [Desulfovibrionaceae bacterium]